MNQLLSLTVMRTFTRWINS